jgi:hypothetical protein
VRQRTSGSDGDAAKLRSVKYESLSSEPSSSGTPSPLRSATEPMPPFPSEK